MFFGAGSPSEAKAARFLVARAVQTTRCEEAGPNQHDLNRIFLELESESEGEGDAFSGEAEAGQLLGESAVQEYASD